MLEIYDNKVSFFRITLYYLMYCVQASQYSVLHECVSPLSFLPSLPSPFAPALPFSPSSPPFQEDEEWKDFASGEQDLTGLKIQTTLGWVGQGRGTEWV